MNVFVSVEDGYRGYVDHIVKYDANGAYVTDFGSDGTGDGQLNYPYGVAVAPSGNVFVADANNNRVVEFAPIPEPFALALLSMGAFGLIAWAWRRNRKPA